MLQILDKNYKHIMIDIVLQKTGVDMSNIAKLPTTALSWENKVIVPLLGYKTPDEFYRTISTFHRIPNIKIPFFVLNSIDDPIVGEACMDYDVFKSNENVILLTTKYGGHLGYFEDVWGTEQWCLKPVFKFLEAYKE